MIKTKKPPRGRAHGLGGLMDKGCLPESQTINPGLKTFTVSAQACYSIVQTSDSDQFFILHVSKWEYLQLMSCPCFTNICGVCICICGKKITCHFSSRLNHFSINHIQK